jgi:pyrimidine operon attenuation protein/uracil phosphoribosyltransferase
MSEIKLREKSLIMSEHDLERCITRMSHEIIEHNKGVENLVIVGMRTRGYHVAGRIAKRIAEIEGRAIPVGALDVTFYRDDFRTILKQPGVKATEIHFEIEDQHVILVDDVLYTGRTVRAALDELVDLGRPRTIQFAALIDRGHREMPIRADYVGKNIPTSLNEEVAVKVKEEDGIDGIWLMEVEA